MKEKVEEAEEKEVVAESSKCPWVMLTVFEKMNYQKAMRYFRFVPFL
jgi:hypothetical protein